MPRRLRPRASSWAALGAMLLSAVLLPATFALAADEPPAAGEAIDFARDIQPLLRAKCWSCHGAEMQEAGLRLDRRRRAFAGGDGGAILVPGDGGASRLLKIVAGDDDEIGQMPPEGTPLSAAEIDRLRRWIEQGAPWPEEADAAGDDPAARHWAFQPLARPPLPAVRDTSWPRTPIDHFVLARLEAEGIAPAAEAERTTLLRRVHLDLLGLPPSPDEVVAFLADDAPDAYERLVERLLASPHYGERWGRRWLDLARYADSDGYEKDRPRPHAWRYRQWVLDALNADLPFDRFSIEQLAGDLLPDAGLAGRIATGLHRNTLHNTEGGIDPEEDRVKKTVDRTNNFGAVWLGLTVGCAQCHSHKYDPLTQREYFQLYGFFNSLQETDVDAVSLHDDQGKAQTVAELAKPRATRLHVRGDFLRPGAAVELAAPEILPPLAPRGDRPDRLDLAQWLFEPSHPLTRRVTVNRLWQRYFGRGLAENVDDFGLRAAPPSHPELLDWLAVELGDAGWSLKHLHRLIVTSAVYRQSAAVRTELVAVDPENELLARMIRRRVEAEVIRDLALAASGLFDPRVGGPSVRPPQPADVAALTYANSAKWEVSKGGDRYRRGLYTFFQRTSPYAMLLTFDAPDSNETCTARSSSNTPLQSLTLWNDAVFFEAAQHLGRRIVAEAPAPATGGDAPPAADDAWTLRAQYAFQACLSRAPTAAELAVARTLYDEQLALLADEPAAVKQIVGAAPAPGGVAAEELAGWILLGRTLLNLDEFITRE